MLRRGIPWLLGLGVGVAVAQTYPLQQALSLFNSGRYREAFDQVESYVQQHPESAGAQKILGMTEFMLGNRAAALATMLKATQLAPQDPDAWYYLGRLYFTSDNATAALAAFEKSRQLNPASVRTVNNLGQTYEALGRFAAAEEAYRDAITLEAREPKRSEWPYYNLGLLYITQGKAEQAIPYFRQALERNPHFADAKIKLAVALSKDKPSQEALDLLQEAARIEPGNPEGHYRLGLLLAKMGRQEESAQELELFRKLKKR